MVANFPVQVLLNFVLSGLILYRGQNGATRHEIVDRLHFSTTKPTFGFCAIMVNVCLVILEKRL